MAAYNYTDKEKEDIILRVCNYISEEKMSTRDALNMYSMPDRNTFYTWLKENETYRDQYARACEERAELIFEEIIEIADDNSFDVSVDDEGKWNINGEVVQRSRLKIDARKWALSKMNPKKYGDKLDVTTEGEKLNSKPDYSNLSNEEIILLKQLQSKL